MPTYRVTGEDGTVYEVDGPEGVTRQQVIAKIKNDLSEVKKHQENFTEIINGIKLIMDEKGIISSEDFETSVSIINDLTEPQVDSFLEEEITKIKKTHH